MTCPFCHTANAWRRVAPPKFMTWITAPTDEPIWPELGRFERVPVGDTTYRCDFCHHE